MSRRQAVIVDLDGTIADKGDRSPFDWSKVGEDTPIEPIVDLVDIFGNQDYWIVYVSGRSDECRDATLKWIDNIGIRYHGYLFMRREGDYRLDTEVKEEIYRDYIEGRWDVKYVLDDRNSVVKMWRSLGLTVLQVAEGDF